jgi:PAS domain S-box-containing protein
MALAPSDGRPAGSFPAGRSRGNRAALVAGVAVFGLILLWPLLVDMVMRAAASTENAAPARARFEYPALALVLGLAVWWSLRSAAGRVDAIRRRNLAMFERAPICVSLQTGGRLVSVNPAGVRMYGAHSAADMIGLSFAELVHPDDRPTVIQRLAAVTSGETELPAMRVRNMRLDGGELVVDAITFPLEIEGRPGTISLLRDVTDEVRARNQAARLADLYTALSKTNEAIFRETDRAALCRAVCDIAVRHGRLLAASIRRYNPGEDSLEVEAREGPGARPPGERTVALARAPSGLVGVVRNATAYICNDVAAEPELAALRRVPQYQGVMATAAFPLRNGANVVGTFSVHAGQKDFFDRDLIDLLEEMARNVAFGFERIDAQAAQRAAEERYRQLFVNVPTGIVVYIDGAVVLANPAALASLGARTDNDVVGRSVLDFMRPENREAGRRNIETALSGGERLERARGILLRTDGTPMHADVSWMPFGFAGRRALLVMISDTSSEVAAREHAERLARLYAALSRTNAAIARETDQTRLCAEVCRVSVEEGGLLTAVIRAPGADGTWDLVASHGLKDGRVGESRMRLDPAVDTALRLADRYVANDLLADRNSTTIQADARRLGIRSGAAFRVTLEPGVFGLFMVFAGRSGFFDDDMCRLIAEIARDLSFAFSKQRADAALRDNEARYRLLFDSSPTGLFVAADDRVVMMNAAGRQLLGAADDDAVLGQSIYTFVRSDYLASARERISVVNQEGRPVPPLERVLIRVDGSEFDAEVTTLPFVWQGRPATQFIVRDLTEHKAVERALRDINNELESRVALRTTELRRANQELRDFSHIVSHDLKAPLRGIASLVDWLEQDHAAALGKEGRELVQLMAVRARRMHRLIEDILRYSRVGRSRETETEVDLGELLRTVIDALSVPPHISVRAVTPLPKIRIARTALEQVFQNLIGNAARYMDKPAGEITVECEAVPGFWRIRVSDNGPGIEPRHHQRIFELFQRLGPRDDSESTGIGLTIVKKIVENLGGSIEIESSPGTGSRFTFTLPRDEITPSLPSPATGSQ